MTLNAMNGIRLYPVRCLMCDRSVSSMMSSSTPHRSDVLILRVPVAPHISFMYSINYILPCGLLMIVCVPCPLIKC